MSPKPAKWPSLKRLEPLALLKRTTAGRPAVVGSVLSARQEQGGQTVREQRPDLWPRGGRGHLHEGRGWALILSTAMLSNSDDNSRMFAVGELGLRQILEG